MYLIAILDFKFEPPLKDESVKHTIKLMDQETQKVFSIAEISKLNKEDMNAYEQSLKYYRDYVNAVSTAREEGIEKARKKG